METDARVADLLLSPIGPLPPAALRHRVAGSPDEKWFDESGARTVDEWLRALRCIEKEVAEFGVIVDYGCGCGRALRHLAAQVTPSQQLIGLDVDREAVEWVGANYQSVQCLPLNETPPGPLPDGSVDLILSHSVFTHLPEEIALSWISDLCRMLKTGGILVTSIHGKQGITEFSKTPLAQSLRFQDNLEENGFFYLAGRSAEEMALPEYYGHAFYKISYVEKYWRQFDIRAWLPIFALKHQDVLVLEKI